MNPEPDDEAVGPDLNPFAYRACIIMLAVVLIIMLAACANTDPHHENIEGRDCIVKRNPVGKVEALSCDWPR